MESSDPSRAWRAPTPAGNGELRTQPGMGWARCLHAGLRYRLCSHCFGTGVTAANVRLHCTVAMHSTLLELPSSVCVCVCVFVDSNRGYSYLIASRVFSLAIWMKRMTTQLCSNTSRSSRRIMRACVCACACVCKSVRKNVCVCARACVRACISACVSAFVRACVPACVRAYLRAFVYAAVASA